MSDLDYVGVRPCGCITAWMSREGSTQGEVKKFYADMAKSGRAVQFMSLEEAKSKNLGECPHREQS